MLPRLFKILASLKLAVVILTSLTAALAAATFIESAYDTPTGQYYVYRTLWFKGILLALVVNLAGVMIDRWPWQRKHATFLLAHIGIITLLFGSWVTDKWGVDGSMRVQEGQVGTVVELSVPQLLLAEEAEVRAIPIPWQPPMAAWKPISTKDHGLAYDVVVDKYISHADVKVSFKPDADVPPSRDADRKPEPAARIRIRGGAMRISQELWLWSGDLQFARVQAGPARLLIGNELSSTPLQGPALELQREADGTLRWRAWASDGGKKEGRLPPQGAAGKTFEPGWRGGVQIDVLDWIPSAVPQTDYFASKVQFGPQAPPSAIHLRSGDAELWLGLGDRAELSLGGRRITIGYFPQRLVLPYGVRLDRFTVRKQQGTMDPSAYMSTVTVMDPDAKPQTVISMNEPLKHKGFTLYQASYEPGEPRPTVSIFSVNQDPGRFAKYFGSILLVAGSILLFAGRYRRRQGPSSVGTRSSA